jgi:hypothetical protein
VIACALPAHAQDIPDAFTGYWKQDSITCTGENPSEPVRELEFTADGAFSVTYLPFETYRDYWGQAAYEADTNLLALSVTGGNQIPVLATLTGEASFLADGKLVLDGFFLSSPHQTGGVCRYVFAR